MKETPIKYLGTFLNIHLYVDLLFNSLSNFKFRKSIVSITVVSGDLCCKYVERIRVKKKKKNFFHVENKIIF